MKRIKLRKNYGLGYIPLPVENPVAIRGNVWAYVRPFDYGGEKGWYFTGIDIANTNKKGHYKTVINIHAMVGFGAVAAHEISLATVDKMYQGFNIAPWAYRVMLNKIPGLVLQAGRIQSPGGRRIWTHLAKYKNVQITAMNRKCQEFDVDVDDVLGELCSDEVNVYDSSPVVTVFAKAI